MAEHPITADAAALQLLADVDATTLARELAIDEARLAEIRSRPTAMGSVDRIRVAVALHARTYVVADPDARTYLVGIAEILLRQGITQVAGALLAASHDAPVGPHRADWFLRWFNDYLGDRIAPKAVRALTLLR